MNYEKALELKKDYPADVKKQINIYSVDKYNLTTRLIGSYSYRSENASDIDLLEEVRKNDIKEVSKFFADNLRKVVTDISSRQNQIFNEVKCGIDHAYDIDFGYCKNNKYYVDDSFFDIMEKYYANGFFNKEEINIIRNIKNSNQRSQYEYEIVFDLIRKHRIVRWTADEIMQGFKELVNKDGYLYTYTLYKACNERSPINVEGIYINDKNRFVDCSNFFWLEYVKDGKIESINLPNETLTDKDNYFAENLKTSMYNLIYSKYKNFNPFKAIKRMFSYARYFEDERLLKFAYDVINSQYGKLYNIQSQMKTVAKAIKTHGRKRLNMDFVMGQLDDLRWALQGIILNGFDSMGIAGKLEQIMSTYNQNVIIDGLTDLASIISSYINESSITILRNNKLYPLPASLTPKIKPF